MHIVKVIDRATNNVLYSCSLENIESAYAEAATYESYGLDVAIEAPTVTQTLAQSLGIKDEAMDVYEESVIAEIHDHDGSCCNKPNQ